MYIAFTSMLQRLNLKQKFKTDLILNDLKLGSTF